MTRRGRRTSACTRRGEAARLFASHAPAPPHRSGPRRRGAAWLLGALAALAIARTEPEARADAGSAADGLALVEQLGAGERAAVERAVAAIERAPAGTPNLGYALFRAGQVCEDALADPARALALYERLVRELPDVGLAIAASRRIERLREQVGAGAEHAREAAELAALIAGADLLPPAEVDRRARALVDAAWPGAPEAALWHAEWLRRSRRLAEAAAQFDAIAARWPASPHAAQALRGAAGTALDARDWGRAAELARRLPAAEPADRVLRDELLEAAARGGRRGHWYALAWLGLAVAVSGLAVSFAEALLRAPRPRRVRPPLELLFLAPVAAVLVGVALTTHELIAPAVLLVSAGGLVLAGLSGATLDLLAARGQPLGRRALLHAALCAAAIAALLYIALTRGDLLDMVIETVRFGPEP